MKHIVGEFGREFGESTCYGAGADSDSALLTQIISDDDSVVAANDSDIARILQVARGEFAQFGVAASEKVLGGITICLEDRTHS